MPIVSIFFGIVIRMFYAEHGGPHFHAEHQGQQGKFGFDGGMTEGNITSRTALRLIAEWANMHRSELETNWDNLKAGRAIERIPPLE